MKFSSTLRSAAAAFLFLAAIQSSVVAQNACLSGTSHNLAKKWGIYDPLADEERDQPNLTVQELLELRRNFHLGYYFFENSEHQRFNDAELKQLKESGLILFSLANSRSDPFLDPDFFIDQPKIFEWAWSQAGNKYIDGLAYNSEAGGSACKPNETNRPCNSAANEIKRMNSAEYTIGILHLVANWSAKYYITFPPPLSVKSNITKYGSTAQFFAGTANVISPWTFSRGEWTPRHSTTANIIFAQTQDLIARWRKYLPKTYPIYPTVDWGRGNFGQVNGTLTFEARPQIVALAQNGTKSVILFDPAMGYRCWKDPTGAACKCGVEQKFPGQTCDTGMQKLVTLADGQPMPKYAVTAKWANGTPRVRDGKQIYQLPSPSIPTVRGDLGRTLSALKTYYGKANPRCIAN